MKKKKKVLLVEDDMPTIDVYKTGLELAGFDIDPVSTGGEAIRIVEEADKNPKKRPDIILLDIIF